MMEGMGKDGNERARPEGSVGQVGESWKSSGGYFMLVRR
jgi:hypothetical protein